MLIYYTVYTGLQGFCLPTGLTQGYVHILHTYSTYLINATQGKQWCLSFFLKKEETIIFGFNAVQEFHYTKLKNKTGREKIKFY